MRFHNEKLLFGSFRAKGVIFFGQNPGFRVKVILLIHDFLGMFDIKGEKIFSAELATVGKVIDSLVAFESFDKFFRDVCIYPDEKDVVVMIFFVIELVIEVFVNKIVNYGVLGLQKHCYS